MCKLRGALLMTTVLAVTLAMACPDNGGKKNRDAGTGPDLPSTTKDLDAGKEAGSKEAGGKDLAVDVKLDKTVNPDLPVPRDLYDLSGEWMPCYGLTGYDNTCQNYKTKHECCRSIASKQNYCPPGYSCFHWDCFQKPDTGITKNPCPVGSFCCSPSSCWCTPSTGSCGSCDSCRKTNQLLPKCPTP